MSSREGWMAFRPHGNPQAEEPRTEEPDYSRIAANGEHRASYAPLQPATDSHAQPVAMPTPTREMRGQPALPFGARETAYILPERDGWGEFLGFIDRAIWRPIERSFERSFRIFGDDSPSWGERFAHKMQSIEGVSFSFRMSNRESFDDRDRDAYLEERGIIRVAGGVEHEPRLSFQQNEVRELERIERRVNHSYRNIETLLGNLAERNIVDEVLAENFLRELQGLRSEIREINSGLNEQHTRAEGAEQQSRARNIIRIFNTTERFLRDLSGSLPILDREQEESDPLSQNDFRIEISGMRAPQGDEAEQPRTPLLEMLSSSQFTEEQRESIHDDINFTLQHLSAAAAYPHDEFAEQNYLLASQMSYAINFAVSVSYDLAGKTGSETVWDAYEHMRQILLGNPSSEDIESGRRRIADTYRDVYDLYGSRAETMTPADLVRSRFLPAYRNMRDRETILAARAITRFVERELSARGVLENLLGKDISVAYVLDTYVTVWSEDPESAPSEIMVATGIMMREMLQGRLEMTTASVNQFFSEQAARDIPEVTPYVEALNGLGVSEERFLDAMNVILRAEQTGESTTSESVQRAYLELHEIDLMVTAYQRLQNEGDVRLRAPEGTGLLFDHLRECVAEFKTRGHLSHQNLERLERHTMPLLRGVEYIKLFEDEDFLSTTGDQTDLFAQAFDDLRGAIRDGSMDSAAEMALEFIDDNMLRLQQGNFSVSIEGLTRRAAEDVAANRAEIAVLVGHILNGSPSREIEEYRNGRGALYALIHPQQMASRPMPVPFSLGEAYATYYPSSGERSSFSIMERKFLDPEVLYRMLATIGDILEGNNSEILPDELQTIAGFESFNVDMSNHPRFNITQLDRSSGAAFIFGVRLVVGLAIFTFVSRTVGTRIVAGLSLSEFMTPTMTMLIREYIASHAATPVFYAIDSVTHLDTGYTIDEDMWRHGGLATVDFGTRLHEREYTFGYHMVHAHVAFIGLILLNGMLSGGRSLLRRALELIRRAPEVRVLNPALAERVHVTDEILIPELRGSEPGRSGAVSFEEAEMPVSFGRSALVTENGRQVLYTVTSRGADINRFTEVPIGELPAGLGFFRGQNVRVFIGGRRLFGDLEVRYVVPEIEVFSHR